MHKGEARTANARYQGALTQPERDDLLAFLRAL